ncbi:uncharacterized protein si:ch211-12e13.10 [Puntigrus tetrazona]|uniref:uncharacterized protein si:ch211-12e13.10 n=1 Tax=Puntigrus tetrazona TaxID=1606681 RepID=UPI001C89ED10|nr:uncharacterized protein si:ch211-12e13.10 [Puntigrus tetrazona]
MQFKVQRKVQHYRRSVASNGNNFFLYLNICQLKISFYYRMKRLLIFASLLSITLCFPVGSPLQKRERRRRQLGFGYGYGHGQAYPFYVPFFQPGLNDDFTPEIYIDHSRPSIPKPVAPRPAVTSLPRRTTSKVPITGDDPCSPPRVDDLNGDHLPVLIYVDPKEWSSISGNQPFSPGQSSDLQPALAIVPGLFLPASEGSQVTQSPFRDTHGLKAPDSIRVPESHRKDC